MTGATNSISLENLEIPNVSHNLLDFRGLEPNSALQKLAVQTGRK
jgi:hypothetical protein